MFKHKKINYKINAKYEPVFTCDESNIGNILFLFDKEKNVIAHYKVEKTTSNYILVRKIAFAGNPIKLKERNLEKFTQETFDDIEIKVIDDKTNDQDLWPTNIKEGILRLKSLYTSEEYSLMKKMSWEQFNAKYNQAGGLSLWIRNYFGLYRGNFDLALDFDIEDPCADNVSSMLVYYFWEYLKDDK